MSPPEYLRMRLVVDGIESVLRHGDVNDRRMFELIKDHPDDPRWCHVCSGNEPAGIRASRPYTSTDEQAWLAGARNLDLDAWGD